MWHVCFVNYAYATVSAEFNYCEVHSKACLSWLWLVVCLTLPGAIFIWWHKAPNSQLSQAKLHVYALPCVIYGTRLPIFSCRRLSYMYMYLQAWVRLRSNCNSVVLPFFSPESFFYLSALLHPLYPTNRNSGCLIFCNNQKLKFQ